MDEDLKKTIEFHGHFCPGLAMGYRVAKYVKKHYKKSEDEELVAIVYNNSCGVDAIQYLLGCTFGKGNLIFKDYGKPVAFPDCYISEYSTRRPKEMGSPFGDKKPKKNPRGAREFFVGDTVKLFEKDWEFVKDTWPEDMFREINGKEVEITRIEIILDKLSDEASLFTTPDFKRKRFV